VQPRARHRSSWTVQLEQTMCPVWPPRRVEPRRLQVEELRLADAERVQFVHLRLGVPRRAGVPAHPAAGRCPSAAAGPDRCARAKAADLEAGMKAAERLSLPRLFLIEDEYTRTVTVPSCAGSVRSSRTSARARSLGPESCSARLSLRRDRRVNAPASSLLRQVLPDAARWVNPGKDTRIRAPGSAEVDLGVLEPELGRGQRGEQHTEARHHQARARHVDHPGPAHDDVAEALHGPVRRQGGAMA
jgi:hypothetical protein